MGQVEMNVTLLAHTQLNTKVLEVAKFMDEEFVKQYASTNGKVIALAAIRQCYSYKKAIEVLETESEKYFGEKGKEGKRLFNTIVKSGHTSTLEHCSFTFAVEGVSRALLAQLTRHRHMSFSVQSQRYNKFSSDSRSGGFDYIVPEKIDFDGIEFQGYSDEKYNKMLDANYLFEKTMEEIQNAYDSLIELGVAQEDARAVLPNAATCNLVMSGNLRTLLEFYKKRKPNSGAQSEIIELAKAIKQLVIDVEPWTAEYFEME